MISGGSRRIGILALLAANILHGQQAPQPAGIRVEMALLSQRYCAEGPIRFLELSVSMRLLNTAKRRLFVLKQAEGVRPEILHVYVAKSESDLRYGMYELSISSTVALPGSVPQNYTLDKFEAVPTRSAYEYRQVFPVPLSEDASRGIGSGPHVASVDIAPWLESPKRAREAEKALALDGMIWTEVSSTEAISFNVAAKHPEEDCYKAFRESRGLK